MSRSPLERELKENGCEVPIGEFQDYLQEAFQGDFQNLSVDGLLLIPKEAILFCDRIRKLNDEYATLSDTLILRCLMARRKNPV